MYVEENELIFPLLSECVGSARAQIQAMQWDGCCQTKKPRSSGLFMCNRRGLFPLWPFARCVTGFVHKHFGYCNSLALGGECPGDAVSVKIDQVPAVCSISDQVAVYAFGF